MTGHIDESLESRLAELTTWRGGETELWKAAMEQGELRRRSMGGVFDRVLNWSMPKAAAVVIGVVLLGAVATALLLRSESRDRSVLARAGKVSQYAAVQNDRQLAYGDGVGVLDASCGTDINGGSNSTPQVFQDVESWKAQGGGMGGAENLHSEIITQQFTPVPGSQESSSRAVVRKATIELTTDDVRGAFLKASHLISEASGEYVQDSTLSGVGKDAQGNLTLRIAVDRLPAVLNELRGLGIVKSENVGGDDVTAQMVDLDARLRNEQRVETELLELLEKRSDAPLKEILELRDQISRVRGTIEQLTAGKERLSRLVSLATVLVIIRPEPEPPQTQLQEKEQTIGRHFQQSMADSWRHGLLFLADTLASLLSILVGGVIWWVALVFLVLMGRQAWRRKVVLAQA